MAVYFKCPHCKKYVMDWQGECEADYEKGIFTCPECGGQLTDKDRVEYDYKLFNQ